MTQEGLGHAVSLTRTSITNIEKGRQPIQVHVLLKIAQALGIRASDLLAPFETPGVELPRLKVKLDDAKLDWVKRVLKEDGHAE